MIEPSPPKQEALVATMLVVLTDGPPAEPIVYGPEVAVHPIPSVTVTVYVPADAPVKFIVGETTPFQSMETVGAPPEVVNPVIEPPEEQVALLTVAVPAIVGPPTVTVTGTLNVLPGQKPT
ncbi:hypothetical protein D3C71_720850 [compost metagenome]